MSLPLTCERFSRLLAPLLSSCFTLSGFIALKSLAARLMLSLPPSRTRASPPTSSTVPLSMEWLFFALLLPVALSVTAPRVVVRRHSVERIDSPPTSVLLALCRRTICHFKHINTNSNTNIISYCNTNNFIEGHTCHQALSLLRRHRDYLNRHVATIVTVAIQTTATNLRLVNGTVNDIVDRAIALVRRARAHARAHARAAGRHAVVASVEC